MLLQFSSLPGAFSGHGQYWIKRGRILALCLGWATSWIGAWNFDTLPLFLGQLMSPFSTGAGIGMVRSIFRIIISLAQIWIWVLKVNCSIEEIATILSPTRKAVILQVLRNQADYLIHTELFISHSFNKAAFAAGIFVTKNCCYCPQALFIGCWIIFSSVFLLVNSLLFGDHAVCVNTPH